MVEGPTWREVLEAFRRAERQMTALAVMTGPVPARMLAAWPEVEGRVERPAELADLRTTETDRARQWKWLWSVRFPDGRPWALWAELASVALHYRRDDMERFVALRVVFPDGSLHGTVRTWLGYQLVEGPRGRGGLGRVGSDERG